MVDACQCPTAAREIVLRGAMQLADVVRVTVGPRSKPVLIQKKRGAPITCDDAVTLARSSTSRIPKTIWAPR
jgi:chaperonin GroEL